PHEDVARLVPAAHLVQASALQRPYQTLPHVSIGDLAGFVERLHSLGGREDLYELARDLQMEADDLLPLAEATELLGFADVQEGDVLLTGAGQQFAGAGVLEQKALFRRGALSRVSLIRQITADLQAGHDHLPEDRILETLEQHFSPEEAKRQLDTAIDWGRYAELFAYEDDTGEFSAGDSVPSLESG
ncbi:AAA-associated domain-containing protein, partial [Nitrolancea hollandica]|uniref:AAA-associated domain-containing protein n=1 Tax=Nitrolancea hollandica TaxID=1206749 RepID=UPI0015678880